ncbi:hypothetical protein F2Q68_00043742 [Brassica cretica]|uniref:Zinc knuckle CX2CX4HX4C domain-containing protein n=1 Tax=Brassica cretica TaxID=69181 RepID=A0A8S9LQE3_BRACR|nr:hypothetical protein F2Q68_00043742 [Brassica cretica]
MFVLVRWEPIVHDDYPWMIPFWTRLIGVPLHLWTENNMREIGSRLGHVNVDTLELAEGRMLIDIDTRRPLKFSRKAESPEGDEVTIEIKYDMLLKHCSTCGMLTNEKEYCPSLGIKDKTLPQLDRPDVFARVQLPAERSQYQLVKKEYRINAKPTQASISYKDRTNRNYNSSRYGHSERKPEFEALSSRENHKGHADRIIRRRNEYSRSSRYVGVQNGKGPYDRHQGTTWREKQRVEHQGPGSSGAPRTRDQDHMETSSVARDAVSYGHASASRTNDHYSMRPRAQSERVQERLIALEDWPVLLSLHLGLILKWKRMLLNILKGLLGLYLLLLWQDGGMVDCEVQNDDKLGMELAEMEDNDVQPVLHKPQKHDAKLPRSSKHGLKQNVPLGIQNKKFEILLR